MVAGVCQGCAMSTLVCLIAPLVHSRLQQCILDPPSVFLSSPSDMPDSFVATRGQPRTLQVVHSAHHQTEFERTDRRRLLGPDYDSGAQHSPRVCCRTSLVHRTTPNLIGYTNSREREQKFRLVVGNSGERVRVKSIRHVETTAALMPVRGNNQSPSQPTTGSHRLLVLTKCSMFRLAHPCKPQDSWAGIVNIRATGMPCSSPPPALFIASHAAGRRQLTSSDTRREAGHLAYGRE